MIIPKSYFISKYTWSALIFLSLGITNIVPYFEYNRLPGALGDTRFNLYVLEHFYQVLIGRQESFIEMPIFFPWSYTIGFSDHHWIAGIPYSLIRLIGLNQNHSLIAWISYGILLNFLISFIILKKLKLSPIACGLGAYLFSFALPALHIPLVHIQLTHRWLVPITFYFLYQFLNQRKLFYLNGFILFFSLQISLSLYIGYLNFLYLSCVVIAFFLIRKNFNQEIISLYHFLKTNLKSIYFWVVSIISFSLLSLFFFPYLLVKLEYGFSRNFYEIRNFLPTLLSYFYSVEKKNINFSSFYKIYSLDYEHTLFIGIIPITLVFLTILFYQRFSKNDQLIKITCISLFLIFIITYNFNGITLYFFITQLPVFSSIKAVSRIILVLLFPIGLICALWVDRINQNQYLNNKINVKAIIFLICFLTIFETFTLNKKTYSFSREESKKRIAELESQLPEKLDKNSILTVATPKNKKWLDVQLDTMLLAQKYQLKTLNGYSGNIPPKWTRPDNCENLKKLLQTIEQEKKIKIGSKSLIMINYSDCIIE